MNSSTTVVFSISDWPSKMAFSSNPICSFLLPRENIDLKVVFPLISLESSACSSFFFSSSFRFFSKSHSYYTFVELSRFDRLLHSEYLPELKRHQIHQKFVRVEHLRISQLSNLLSCEVVMQEYEVVQLLIGIFPKHVLFVLRAKYGHRNHYR